MTGSFPPRSGTAGKQRVASAVGRKLQQARVELAASEDFVASALGLSLEAYRDVECGAARLSPGAVIQAARLFGLQPSALCGDSGGTAEPAPKPSGSAAVIDFAAARLRRRD